ncbi:MAG: LamG-like jellyroll fold domain-containing protein, partial [Pirellulales bacterium]
DGNWHHVVASWDTVSDRTRLFIDGALAGSAARSTSAIGAAGSFIIAQEQDSLLGGFANNQRFVGDLDEVAIYNTVLSDSTIASHYDAGFGAAGNGTGLMKSGSGTVTLAGNNNYDGEATVMAGVLVAASDTALGTDDGNTTVASGATLRLSGGVNVASESLTLGSSAAGNPGTLESGGGNNIYAGPITAETAVTGEIQIVSSTAGGKLSITGDISLQQSKLTVDGAGDTAISGQIVGGGDIFDPTYSDAVLALPGVEGYWKFETIDGGNGTPDSSPNGRNGAVDPGLAAVNPVGGRVGNAIDFNTFDDDVVITDYDGVTKTDTRSAVAWVRFEVGGPNDQGIMHWGQNAGGKKWTFRTQDDNGSVDGNLRLEVNGGYITGNTDIRDGQWHHVAVVFDRAFSAPVGSAQVNDIRLYVDGQLDAGFGTSVPPNALLNRSINTAKVNDVRIGRDEGGRDWRGLIDEPAIFSTALTNAQIASLYNAADGVGIVPADNSLIKMGAGVLTLMNDSNTYAGGTTVADGTLLAGGGPAATTTVADYRDDFATGARLTAGATLDFNASLDTDGDASWESTTAQQGFNWSLGGNVSRDFDPDTNYAGITAAYDFPTSGSSVNADRATAATYNNLPGSPNPTAADTTWEIWFKPDNLGGGDQILWESGGSGTGASFTIAGGDTLQFTAKNGGTRLQLQHALSAADISDFVQAVVTYDRNNPGDTDTLRLYVNGTLSTAQTSNNVEDWAGGNNSALGGKNNDVGGSLTLSEDLSAYGTFAGQIAAFRLYESPLAAAAVQNNFDAVVGADLRGGNGAGWEYLWNEPADWDPGDAASPPAASYDPAGGRISEVGSYRRLLWSGNRWTADGDNSGTNGNPDRYVRLHGNGGHPGAGAKNSQSGIDRYAIAAYTVADAGLYSITDSFVTNTNTNNSNGGEIRISVNDTLIDSVFYVNNATVSFDTPLGILNAGDKIYVAQGPNGSAGSDGFAWDFSIRQTTLGSAGGGDVDVQNGATLGGTGNITGRVDVEAGGEISAGGDMANTNAAGEIGTLTVCGLGVASGPV